MGLDAYVEARARVAQAGARTRVAQSQRPGERGRSRPGHGSADTRGGEPCRRALAGIPWAPQGGRVALPRRYDPGSRTAGFRMADWGAAHEANNPGGEEYNNGRFCPPSVT
ncbi:hypothetical protein GCM10009787_50170 [Streptomyces bangladeshensis]|uniref:Uncharacterized protein n=1 Tax=Streptomyces bangladeshensis TaxID=295352 RepID=A0ABN3BUI7_9ACTN